MLTQQQQLQFPPRVLLVFPQLSLDFLVNSLVLPLLRRDTAARHHPGPLFLSSGGGKTKQKDVPRRGQVLLESLSSEFQNERRYGMFLVKMQSVS